MFRQHTTAESVTTVWAVLLALLGLSGCGDQISPVSPTNNASTARAAAAAPLTISGYVYQAASGAGEPPIADAVITLRDAQGAERMTKSDRRGFYVMRASLGEVVVTAAKDGYNTRESRFDVTDSTVLNFGLAPLLP
jgi:Carboxypeptidase regulatory-like domain